MFHKCCDSIRCNFKWKENTVKRPDNEISWDQFVSLIGFSIILWRGKMTNLNKYFFNFPLFGGFILFYKFFVQQSGIDKGNSPMKKPIFEYLEVYFLFLNCIWITLEKLLITKVRTNLKIFILWSITATVNEN